MTDDALRYGKLSTMGLAKPDRLLFSELVIQIITLLRYNKLVLGEMGLNSWKRASNFSRGDRLLLWIDMSLDAEIVEFLSLCGVYDQKFGISMNRCDMRRRFSECPPRISQDMNWPIEIFFDVVNSRDCSHCHFILEDSFYCKGKFERLFDLFVDCGYARRSNDTLIWTAKMARILGMEWWGIYTDRGREARNYLRLIWKNLPDKYKIDVLNGNSDLPVFLTNYWYLDRINSKPVCGDNTVLQERNWMEWRAYYISIMARGECAFSIDTVSN